VKSDHDGVVEIAWSLERNHHPVAVGVFAGDTGNGGNHAPEIQAIALANAYLRQKRQWRMTGNSSASRSRTTPNWRCHDANSLGNLLGGKIMHLVDLAGAIAAMRHAGMRW